MIILDYELNNILNLYKFIVTAAFFSYAAYKDIKYREISDTVWILLILLTLPASLYQIIILNSINIFYFLFVILINSLIASMMYYIADFGGADAIAAIVLAVAIPYAPNLGFKTLLVQPPDFPLAVLWNGIIISIFYILVNIVKNTITFLKEGKLFDNSFSLKEKIILFLFGEKINREKIEKGKFYVSLIIMEKGKKKLSLFRKVRNLDFQDTFARKGYYDDDYYWVENIQPFLLYLTISLFFTIFIGDLISSIALFII